MLVTDQHKQQPVLGGMALNNGVLVVAPNAWAVSVRARDGSLITRARRRPSLTASALDRLPVARGTLRIAEMFLVLARVRRATPQARFAFDSPAILGAVLLSSVATHIVRAHARHPLTAEWATGVVSLAPMLIALRRGELAQYHGAEHKAIAAVEQGRSSAEVSRVHPRCGTQLAIPLIGATAVTSVLTQMIMPRRLRTARLLAQVVGMGIAVEIVRAAQAGRGGRAVRSINRAGRALQEHVTTREPRADQLIVADAAVAAALVANKLAHTR